MAKIRHIAIKVEDQEKAANFYKQTFGMTEAWRGPVRDDGNRPARHRGVAEAVVMLESDPAARSHAPPERLVLEGNPEIVAAGIRFVTRHLVAQRAPFPLPVRGKRLVLCPRCRISSDGDPVSLVARVVTMQVRSAVVGKIEELERGDVSVELRCVWRIESQVGRLLPCRGQPVRGLLPQAR